MSVLFNDQNIVSLREPLLARFVDCSWRKAIYTRRIAMMEGPQDPHMCLPRESTDRSCQSGGSFWFLVAFHLTPYAAEDALSPLTYVTFGLRWYTFIVLFCRVRVRARRISNAESQASVVSGAVQGRTLLGCFHVSLIASGWVSGGGSALVGCWVVRLSAHSFSLSPGVVAVSLLVARPLISYHE